MPRDAEREPLVENHTDVRAKTSTNSGESIVNMGGASERKRHLIGAPRGGRSCPKGGIEEPLGRATERPRSAGLRMSYIFPDRIRIGVVVTRKAGTQSTW